ncbi:hypothetical protein C1H46_036624 [Malus baccata]|uniref:NPH3 domain-containing protein n=1 Tax=Malus baccata TaxID=106549 RepID=A0A540KUB9_MALBA|nr:hypothetical protein C1H46_036624 [Malus baccata]
MLVGKLIDEFLSEIATDVNLKPDRFYNLAISLPDQTRLFDDGLYRAVDVYLKAHPWLLEPEREKVCGIFDCQKLTLEACTHAAQNERLPPRAVVQVLSFSSSSSSTTPSPELFSSPTAFPRKRPGLRCYDAKGMTRKSKRATRQRHVGMKVEARGRRR